MKNKLVDIQIQQFKFKQIHFRRRFWQFNALSFCFQIFALVPVLGLLGQVERLQMEFPGEPLEQVLLELSLEELPGRQGLLGLRLMRSPEAVEPALQRGQLGLLDVGAY